LRSRWGSRLSADYLAFLQSADGAYLDHFELWSTAEVLADNYRAEEFGPHLVFVGSNLGGELFAFDERSQSGEVSMVAAVSDWLTDAVVVARDFPHLLERMERSIVNDAYSLLQRDW
jgi:hypothetical protein